MTWLISAMHEGGRLPEDVGTAGFVRFAENESLMLQKMWLRSSY
jgi:hypothetical protein